MEIEDPKNFPLVERINKAEHLARELCEHLKQGFLPKLVSLRSSSKKFDPNEVSDQTMFDQMSEVVKAEKFATEVYERLIKFLQSIENDSYGVLGIDASLTAFKDRKNIAEIQDIVMEE